MSTTVLTIPDTEVTLKWRQPYVSEALNRKLSVVPRGVSRGFVLTRDGANNDKVILAVDPATGDSAVNGSGTASSGGGDFFVTWRVLVDQSISIAVDGNLHFLCFVPGYTSGAATSPKVIDYTEAEYEAGVPSAAGGVLLGVVKANSVAGLIPSAQCLTGGMTNTSFAPFVRETAASTAGGSHAQGGGEEALALFCGFDSDTDRGLIEASAGALLRSNSSSISFDTTTFETGTASLKFVKGAAETTAAGPSMATLTKAIPVYRDTTSGRPRKIRIATRFKVDATWNLIGVPGAAVTGTLVEFKAADGSSAMAGSSLTPTYALYAPTTGAQVNNATKSTNWTWIVYELEVPDVIGASPVISAGITLAFGEQVAANSTMWVDRVLVTLSRQASTTQSVIDRAGSPQLATTGNAGNQTQQLMFSYGPSSGAVTNYAFKKSAANASLLLVPDRTDVTNKVVLGEAAVSASAFPSDPVGGVLTARYATLEVLGDAGGVNYGVRTVDAPIIATGTGANISAAGTIAATGVLSGGSVASNTFIAANTSATIGTDLTLMATNSLAKVDGGTTAAVRAANLQLTGTATFPKSGMIQFTDGAGAVANRLLTKDYGHSVFWVDPGDIAELVTGAPAFIRPIATGTVSAEVNINSLLNAAGLTVASGLNPQLTTVQVFGVVDASTAPADVLLTAYLNTYDPVSAGGVPLVAAATTGAVPFSSFAVTGTGANAAASYLWSPGTFDISSDYNWTLNLSLTGPGAKVGFGVRFVRLTFNHRCIVS